MQLGSSLSSALIKTLGSEVPRDVCLERPTWATPSQLSLSIREVGLVALSCSAHAHCGSSLGLRVEHGGRLTSERDECHDQRAVRNTNFQRHEVERRTPYGDHCA